MRETLVGLLILGTVVLPTYLLYLIGPKSLPYLAGILIVGVVAYGLGAIWMDD